MSNKKDLNEALTLIALTLIAELERDLNYLYNNDPPDSSLLTLKGSYENLDELREAVIGLIREIKGLQQKLIDVSDLYHEDS